MLIFTGVGASVLVLCVGSAFALVAWLNKRATTIYPNESGQYPVVIRRGLGWIAFHDPNRGLGPGSIYHTPTFIEQAANATASAAAAIGGVLAAFREGESPALLPLETADMRYPKADYPLPGGEGTMAQIATQAQAVSLMTAATRQDGNPQVKKQVGRIAKTLLRPAPQEVRPTLPPVTVLAAEEAEVFIHELLLSAPEEIADMEHPVNVLHPAEVPHPVREYMQ